MQEFTTVSSSSYDPAALATKLTEKSAEGWTVVSIVSTGGDVTAFLSRESSGADTSAATSSTEPSAAPAASSTASTGWGSGSTLDTGAAAATTASTIGESSWGTGSTSGSTPVVESTPEPAASEPAGWAVAPDPAPATPAADPQPAAAATYTPAAATTSYSPAPAAATPAVPAGWYADPAGRFELRYWDGGTWTEHVSRAGQQYTDPPVA